MTVDVKTLCAQVEALGQERDRHRAEWSSQEVVLARVQRELGETRTSLTRAQDAHRRLEEWTREERADLRAQVARLEGELKRERDAHHEARRQAEAQQRRLKEIEAQIGGLMSLADLDASAPRRSPEDASREPSGVVS